MRSVEPELELKAAGAAIALALMMLEPHRDLLERFEQEAVDLESFGHIVDPTLFRRAMSEPWRQDVRAVFAAARRFLSDAGASREQLLQHASGEEHVS